MLTFYVFLSQEVDYRGYLSNASNFSFNRRYKSNIKIFKIYCYWKQLETFIIKYIKWVCAPAMLTQSFGIWSFVDILDVGFGQ